MGWFFHPEALASQKVLSAYTNTNKQTLRRADHMRRAAFLQALRDDPQLTNLLPLVRKLYSTPSTYLWSDDKGDIHQIRQGEGGEQGDPLMPALYALA